MNEVRYPLLSLIADGGAMMIPLVAASLIALAVILAKAYTLWAVRRHSRAVLERTVALGREGRLEDALSLVAHTPGPVAAVLYAGLRRMLEPGSRVKDIERTIKATGSVEVGFLERGLVVLATVANVAPLLGFLGTVAGMIAAFGAIAAAGQVEAALVAGGIKVALITTAAGLAIAVPVNVAYNFFVSRIDRVIVEMEEGSAAVINLFWDRLPPGPGGADALPAEPLRERPDVADSIPDVETDRTGRAADERRDTGTNLD